MQLACRRTRRNYTMTTSLGCVAIYTLGIIHIAAGFIVDVTSNGKVVRGATVQFSVEIFTDDGHPASGKFHYSWTDLTFKMNNASYDSSSSVSHWNLTCDSKYTPGNYSVELVVIEHSSIIYIPYNKMIANRTIQFEVTKMLNGELVLSQGNHTEEKFVASSMPLNHSLSLKPSDLAFVKVNRSHITSFWFIDCVYYGQKSGLVFDYNYTKSESNHVVEALLIATSEPVNFTGVTTFSGNSSEVKNISSDVNNVNATIHDKLFADWLTQYNKTHVKGNSTGNSSDSCLDVKNIPLNENYTYGLFSAKFSVKDPVKVSPINGTNWLQDGEILNITVSCTGASPFKYCYRIFTGLYNVTGNEVCEQEETIKNCSFNIQHLFTESTEYTIVVFISNSVSHVIKPIAVNIYKVKKRPQLSVIIVPVAFSMVAVILIIFGVAYYVQSKRSYTVEVADFDFANQSSDMEYKSFRERLRESVSNLFLKSNDFNDDEDDDQVWSPNRKYGSMQ